MDTMIDTHRGVKGDDVICPLGAGESVRLGELLELDFTGLVFNVHDAHEAEDLAAGVCCLHQLCLLLVVRLLQHHRVGLLSPRHRTQTRTQRTCVRVGVGMCACVETCIHRKSAQGRCDHIVFPSLCPLSLTATLCTHARIDVQKRQHT